MQIELANTLDRQQQIEKRIGQLSRNVEQAILELQTSLQLPEPVLTGQSSPKELKGIGPKTAAALEDLNIMTVTDLLVANPLDVSKHTRLTHEQIEQLRNSIQLLMIPDLSYADLALLEEVGVSTRRDLATQDPLELNLMLSNVAQSYLEAEQLSKEEIPTLEEILLLVRVAKR
jgi:predicted RecB family nuclease